MMLVKGNLDRRNFKGNIGSWFLPCLYNFLSLYHLFVYFLLSLLEQITNSYHCEPSSWKELLSASFWVGFSFLTYVQRLKHCWNKRPEDGGKDARQECGEWKRSCLQGFEGGLSTHTRMHLHTHTCVHTHASTHKCTQVCFIFVCPCFMHMNYAIPCLEGWESVKNMSLSLTILHCSGSRIWLHYLLSSLSHNVFYGGAQMCRWNENWKEGKK